MGDLFSKTVKISMLFSYNGTIIDAYIIAKSI